MAHSPSPLVTAGQSNLHSASPPLQRIISKREKKKHSMEDRFTQISNDFNENRDIHYRKQIQAFQVDIDFIRHAELYADKPLEETIDDNPEEATTSAGISTHGSVRTVNLNGNARYDAPLRPGPYAAQFIQRINDAMEQRDADLTTLAYRHNSRIDELQRDNDYHVAVAFQEHQQLIESLRCRLMLNLQQKKAMLQKEKEKLDVADTNSLLYHPNHFNLNNGASPGGPQSNRKTRHTRHRLDVDDLDTANGGTRRKRKGPSDADNGSPAPAGRDVEVVNPVKETSTKLEYQQTTSSLYSLDRLFTPRELEANCQAAQSDVIEGCKRRKLNKDSRTNLNSLVGTDIDASDSDENADAGADLDGVAEDVFLAAAPEMERVPTNASQHLTRSTRTLNPIKGTSGPGSLGYLAGRAAGVACVGSIGQKDKKRDDEYQRAPPLTETQVDDDIVTYQAAMADEDAEKPNDQIFDDVLDDSGDYLGNASTEGEESGAGE